MKNYICKWPNDDVVFITARDKQQVREILDEVGDPGSCDIRRFKGPLAIEFLPKVPHPPAPEGGYHKPRDNYFGNVQYEAPQDPKLRPRVMRYAGNTGESFPADIWEAVGGKLSAAEAAALQRWRQATQPQQTAAAGAAGEEKEPWVTEQQLQETGMIDNPYYVHMTMGYTQYGSYSSRLMKAITREFYPRTHQALKGVAALESPFCEDMVEDSDRTDALKELRAALSADIQDEGKEDDMEKERARRMVAALAGDRNALLQIMTDQTANVYGPQAGDDDDDEDDEEEDYDDDDSDDHMDIFSAIRHGRAMDLAAALGVSYRA